MGLRLITVLAVSSLSWCACGMGSVEALPPDADVDAGFDAFADAAVSDDAGVDSEVEDSGIEDSGVADGGVADGGVADGGLFDAGFPLDAGTIWACTRCVQDGGPVLATPSAPKPPYLTPTVLSPFSTSVTRLAGDPATVTGGVTWDVYARHHYSTDQPWNADSTIFRMSNGSSALYLDGQTYAPRATCAPNGDARWHPLIPQILIVVKRDRVFWWDVVTCVETRSWTLPIIATGLGNYEGNPSNDGRYLLATNATEAVLVDMNPLGAGRVGPVRNMGVDCTLTAESGCAALTRPCCEIDSGTVSPSGRYALIKYNGGPHRVFDIDANLALTPRPLTKDYRATCPSPSPKGTASSGYTYLVGHADLALDPFDGNEDVIVGVEGCWNDDGKIVEGKVVGDLVKVRVRDGQMTPVSPPSTFAAGSTGISHVSTRNTGRPGWAYVSYHFLNGNKYSSEIASYKLDGSNAVERWGFTRTENPPYEAEPHVVPSPDGQRVAFVSNWLKYCSTGCGTLSNAQSYVVDGR